MTFTPEQTEIIRKRLEERLPEFVFSEMDGGIFIKTLQPDLKSGNIVVKEGEDGYPDQEFVVQYAWHWTTYVGNKIYMAELEPKGASRGGPNPSKLQEEES